MSLLELKEIMTVQERYQAEKPGALPDDLYLRRWTSPALNTAPDIWIAGNVPLPDIQKLSENYATDSSDVSLQARQDNYIYVRARNNASEPRRRRVAQLYAAELDLIMWPHSWKEIYTDTGSNISPFATVASQAVAVATETFVFPYVMPATSGYTLIAQINDLSNQLNPKPQQSTPLDMAAFNADPLWASTNTCLIPAQGYVVKMDTRLTTASTPKAGGTYLITLDVKGCVGTEVELKGSTADSKGKPAPCILAHPADSSSIKEGYSRALRARRFTTGVELNVRIAASNNASTPKSNRIACLYYVEKDYLPFTAHWQEVRTYQGH